MSAADESRDESRVVSRIVPGNECGEYTNCYPYRYDTFSPWFAEPFTSMFQAIRSYTVNTEDRCYVLHELCRQAAHLDGEFAECGVYRGGTSLLLAKTLESVESQARLHLFDTFEGMPGSADDDACQFTSGSFADTSVEAVREILAPYNNAVLHPGEIPSTLDAVDSVRFAMVHIDVDLYESAKDCCEFFYPRMGPAAVMVFDDYGFPNYRESAKRAVDEFFADKKESVLSLHTGQALVTHL